MDNLDDVGAAYLNPWNNSLQHLSQNASLKKVFRI